MTIGSMISELAELTPAALHQRLIAAEAKFVAFEQRLIGIEQLIEDVKPTLQTILAAVPPGVLSPELSVTINAIIARIPDAPPIVTVSPAPTEAPSAT